MLIEIVSLDSMLHLPTLFGGGGGGTWLERRVQATLTTLFEKQGLKIALFMKKNKTQYRQVSQRVFSMIV